MDDSELPPELFDNSQFDLHPKVDIGTETPDEKVPVTIITGYLGSGKS